MISNTNCVSTTLATEYGDFIIYVLRVGDTSRETVILVHGQECGERPIVRLHSECLTGDIFHSLHCDCFAQLEKSLILIGKSRYGALLYLRQEGRGIGLYNKIRAYALQRQGLDTVDANVALGLPADGRDYKLAAQILKDLNMTNIDLITNNPEKVKGLQENGIIVNRRIPCIIEPTEIDAQYLATKKKKMGHLL